MARNDNLLANDLDIYILKNSRFKSFIFDRKEIRSIADNLGLLPDCVRTELREQGYGLLGINMAEWSRREINYDITFLATMGIWINVQNSFGPWMK